MGSSGRIGTVGSPGGEPFGLKCWIFVPVIVCDGVGGGDMVSVLFRGIGGNRPWVIPESFVTVVLVLVPTFRPNN